MRILITGASGSGTTTLSRELSQQLPAVCLQTDDYFWLPTTPPFSQKREPAERLAMLMQDLAAAPRAVIGGSIVDWGATLEDSLTLIVFLIVPAAIRVERLRRREIELLGHADPAFIDWAAQYDSGTLPGRSRAKHERWLAQHRCRVVRIEGEVTVEAAVNRVLSV